MSLAGANVARFAAFIAGACALSMASGCKKQNEAAPALLSSAPSEDEKLAELLQIESRLDADAITAKDFGHRDVAFRRASARALARMSDRRAHPKLVSLLSDEDAEVVAHAAHGLSWLCDIEGIDARETTGALVARSISLPEAPTGSDFEPSIAISRALAHCATKEGERTLTAWLSRPAPWNAAAALGLGTLASRTKDLSEEAQEALLDAVKAELDEALFALGRLEKIAPSLRQGLLEASRSRLSTKGQNRLFAVRALGRAGFDAVPDLERVLLSQDGDFDAAERSEAARSLARLGQDGERALAEALASLLRKDDSLSSLTTDAFGPLLVTVEMLRGALSLSRERLRELTRMPVPEGAEAPLQRRLSLLRCAAARRLPDAKVGDAFLAACDREALDASAEEAKLETGKPAPPKAPTKPVKLTFVLDSGSASMSLDPKLAPASVARFVELSKGGHFDGATLRLVVPGSFVQLGPASKEPRPPLPRETSPIAFEPFHVGVALDREKDTGSDKLFVTLGKHPELDGQYTWLGRAEPAFAKLAEGDVIEKVIVEER